MYFSAILSFQYTYTSIIENVAIFKSLQEFEYLLHKVHFLEGVYYERINYTINIQSYVLMKVGEFIIWIYQAHLIFLNGTT